MYKLMIMKAVENISNYDGNMKRATQMIFLILITVLMFLTGCVRVTEETQQEKYSELLEKFHNNDNKLLVLECISIANRYTCMTYQGYYITTEEELRKYHDKYKNQYNYMKN